MQRPTIGIDFISQNIFLEDKTIRLQLWDTAGQERFKALIPNYIRDTSVAVIVYDVTSRNSFKSIQKWIDDVKNQRGDGVIIALLANKIDLEERDTSL
jgi:Ras-related protein Rab-6A